MTPAKLTLLCPYPSYTDISLSLQLINQIAHKDNVPAMLYTHWSLKLLWWYWQWSRAWCMCYTVLWMCIITLSLTIER